MIALGRTYVRSDTAIKL